jgi:LPXTG-site transpeptidase (sortase) family protein
MNLKNFSKRNILGIALIGIGLFLIYFTYFPVAREEIKYQVRRIENKQEEIIPPNEDFSIVIPKLGAVAPVVAKVDPLNQGKYLAALKEGVAQAKTSALPDEGGNIFIFAHSTDTFYNVGKYNAVFYLIGKLDKGDEIFVYYQNRKYTYQVEEKKVVGAGEIKYLERTWGENTLILQTCYPPGTTLRRLIVIAKLKI